MYGKNDRDLLQGVYAKLCAMESKLRELEQQLEPKLGDSESPFLGDNGLYSRKALNDYKAKAEKKGTT